MPGVGAERRADVDEPGGQVERGAAQVDHDLRGGGDVPEVGEQAVRDVDHRRGARARGFGPAAYGGSGTRCAFTTTAASGSHAAARRARPRPTDPPADRHEVAGRAPPRITGARPSRFPSAVTASTTLRGRGHVAADHAGPCGLRLRPQPARDGLKRRHGRGRGARQADEQGRRHGAHRRDVRQVAAAGRRPICSGVDQSSRKCTVSTRTSVVATIRPSGAATTAASSPGPTRVDG